MFKRIVGAVIQLLLLCWLLFYGLASLAASGWALYRLMRTNQCAESLQCEFDLVGAGLLAVLFLLLARRHFFDNRMEIRAPVAHWREKRRRRLGL